MIEGKKQRMECRNVCTFDGRVVRIGKVRQFRDRRCKLTSICRYMLEVPRPQHGYDHILCTAFGNRAWYAKHHITKGMWLTVVGHLYSEVSLENSYMTRLTVHYQKIKKGDKSNEKMETET